MNYSINGDNNKSLMLFTLVAWEILMIMIRLNECINTPLYNLDKYDQRF